AFSPKAKWLASTALPDKPGAKPRMEIVHVWELASGQTEKDTETWSTDRFDLHGHKRPVTAVAFGLDDHLLASPSHDGDVRIWDLNTKMRRTVHHLQGHKAKLTHLVWSPTDAKRLATAASDGAVRLWDLAPGAQRLDLPGHQGPITNLFFSPDGRILVSA